MIFKPITKEEYERLSLQERMNYLQRLMDDIRQKLDENRRKLEQTKKLSDGQS